MKRNVLLLALAQALMISATSLQISAAALVGQALGGPTLATVPLGLMYLGSMLATFPASFYMRRCGRRIGFMTSAVIGISSATLATYAIVNDYFILFCCATLLSGVFNGFGQYYRFAAADTATEAFRSRAIAYVLAGGVLAAFIGPNLAALTRLSGSVPFAGSYAALIGVYGTSLLISSLLRIAKPGLQELAGPSRPLAAIARQPTYVVAVLGAMVGYGVMNLVMTATPLAMHDYHHSFTSTAHVIQWHVLAMFVPSFFTGHLIRRVGVLNVMLVGGLLMIGCVTFNFTGTSVLHFTAALVLLGTGWNFLYIGGTTLLTETYRPAEKAKAQAGNDFLVFSTVTCTALSAGALHRYFGWDGINAGVLPLIVLTLIATAWLRQRAGTAAPAQALD